ncbi:hypothetical protein RRG44_02620 [Mycoplasmopsis cynos]|uniref:hypothetical protein n=1 Tax=Mycoplasmopsis cynos TaxID=171284 RepID=UPI002AFFFD95|nr:hypothetical protein [Mycoplasmopsis cynos]WQQ18989.1 hypothetical protein RRG44_02620 [Mycoplasmopsis cynos]
MSKYKKIFSGLGLLSISTLVGASVVACANKKPEASGSIIENLATAKQEALAEVEKLQGHEKYTELKAIIDKENATIEELNSAKTSAIEELNKYKEKIQTAIDSIKEETRKTELKTKLEAAGTYKELKAIKDEISATQSTPQQTPGEKGQNGEGMGTEDLTTLKKEAIDAVEEIKGHSRYDELKTKVDKDGATKEELNSAKTSATEILNKYKKEVEANFEAIKDKTSIESQKSKLESINKYQELKNINAEILPIVKKELSTIVNELEYKMSKESTATKDKLKEKINKLDSNSNYALEYKNIINLSEALKMKNSEIDSLYNLNEFNERVRPKESDDSVKNFFKSKLSTLDTAEKISAFTIPEEFKTKFNKYKELINDPFWGIYDNQYGLNGRWLIFKGENDENKDDDFKDKYSEATLIFHIYETIRQRAYNAKIDNLNLTPEKKKEYKDKVEILPDGKTNKNKTKNDKRYTHGKDMKWLVEKLDKLKEEYKKAEKEATKSQTSASR